MAVSPVDFLGGGGVEFASPSRAIVVIDASIEGRDRLAGSFADAAATLVIDSDDDLFSTVEGELARLGGVSAIHLVSHGSPGSFSLGSTRFSSDTIDEIDDGLVAWNRLAGPGSDLFVWGCDVAGGDGASLIDSLHGVSGFDVAASIDLTGPGRLGGDFDLEYAAGDVADPGLVAGVDVLWDTALAAPEDFALSAAKVRTAVQGAFNRLDGDIAPAVSAALTGRTGSQADDAYSQRKIAELFTATTSVSPADVAAILSVKTAVATYLATGSPTLNGLGAEVKKELERLAAAAGTGPATVSVTPGIVKNGDGVVTTISLAVEIAATGTATKAVDRGTDQAPTVWGRVYNELDAAVSMELRGTPALRSGTTFTGAFTVSVDVRDADVPVASIAIPTLKLSGGLFGHDATAVRFGALDATLAATATPGLVTSVTFSGGADRTVSGWASVGATASVLPSPTVTVEMPVVATLGGSPVTSAATKVSVSGDLAGSSAPTVALAGFERVRWFGGISSDDIVAAVLAAGGVYESYASATGPLGFGVPFVQDRSLASFMPFARVFDSAVADAIDVTTTTTVNGQSVTGRPADMQTFGDFAAKFPALGFQPVYDAAAGTVSLQVSSARTETVKATPAVQFAIAPLGRLGFSAPPERTVSVPVGLGFGVQFKVGPVGPIVLGLSRAAAASGRLSSDVELTIKPALGVAASVTIRKADTDGNGSVDELLTDVNAALAGTLLRVRRSEFGAGLEFFTPTVDAGMPTAITLEAKRSSGAADLGFDDGLPADATAPITAFARATGSSSTLVPHASLPFASGSMTVPLAGLAGAVTYGLNTLAFTGTSGSTAAAVSIALPAAGGVAETLASDPALLAMTITDAANVTLSGLSRVGATNDVSPSATIGIRVDDFAAETVAGFKAVGVPLPVIGLEFDGRTTGRLAADAAVQFAWRGTTYEIVVASAASLDNTSFAGLLDDFNLALRSARVVTNGVAAGGPVDLSADLAVTGSGGRITILCTSDTPQTTLLTGRLVPNLAPGGATTGRLAAGATLSFVDGSTTYAVTVSAAAAADNTTFAQLIDDFNAARATATRKLGTGAAEPFDATAAIRFTAGTGTNIQPQVAADLPNPNYAAVTLPPVEMLGEAGYQSKLTVPAVADALRQATRVFSTLARDLRDYADVTWPLLTGPLSEYISFDTGLPARLATLGTLTANSPAELERAIERAMSLPTSDLAITFDAARKAYRIDLAYRTSVARKVEFEADMLPYYQQLGRLPPKGVDQLVDGDAKTPMDLVLKATSVLSVGIDLSSMRTFLYGHDGGQTAGVGDGTSFRIDVSLDGKKLEFPARFGMFVKEGKAAIENGALVVRLVGPAGTPPSAVFYVSPQGGELAALAIANYTSQVTGKVVANMPIWDEFAPATTTQQSIKNGQAWLKSDYDAIKKHPASFYMGIRDLGTYLRLSDEIDTARAALSALRQAGRNADDAGVTQAQWQQRLDLAAADLPDALRVFAPELDNVTSVFGSDNSVFDLVRDPAVILDTLDTVMRLFENSMRTVNNLDLPLIGDKLGGAVNGIFGFRRGWMLDMRRRLRGAGQQFFDKAREGIFEALGPQGANILLAFNGLNGLRSVEGMVPAQRPGDVGLAFFDEFGNELKNNVRGATAFEFNIRIGQKFFDTGIDLGFTFDALEPFVSLALDGGLRLGMGWDLSIGFGVDRFQGPYIKLDPDNPEVQVRFDATLVGESAKYTQSWDATGKYWKIVDGNGQPVIDPTTNAPYRALAVDKYGADVTATLPRVQVLSSACNVGSLGGSLTLGDTASYPTSGAITITDGSASTVLTFTGNDTTTGTLSGVAYKSGDRTRTYAAGSRVSLNPESDTDECECDSTPSRTRSGAPIWWVVAARTPSGDWKPAEFNDMRQYVAQDSPFVHTMIEVRNMAPARLTGGLSFLKLAASDMVRRGLSNYSDFDGFYTFDTSTGPQVEAKDRDNKDKGVNRNNELPTTFTGVIGIDIRDPSATKGTYTALKESASGGPDGYILADADNKPIVSGTSTTPLREYYPFQLKQGPGANYRVVDIPVRVATAANIDLQGVRIVDGVQLMVGDFVLVKDQTLAEQNGIYRVSSGRWERALAADTSEDFNVGKPLFVLITEGRTNKNTGWAVDDRIGSIELGRTPLIFTRVQAITVGALGFATSVPYVPFTTVLVPKSMVDEPTATPILVNIFFDNANYLVEVPATSSTGAANRAAQLTFALRNAAKDENNNGKIDGDEGQASNRRNLIEAGYAFSIKGAAKPKAKFYAIEQAELDKDGREKNPQTGTYLIGPDLWRPKTIGSRFFAIDDDASKDRLTFTEMRVGGLRIFKPELSATAVVNLQLELFMSMGDKPDAMFANVPRLYADLNLDWTTASARYSVEQKIQKVQDAKDSGAPSAEGVSDSDQALLEEEQQAKENSTTGGDKGLDPSSKLATKYDFLPEIGISNIRLDLGEFLSDFLQPNLKRADPYLEKIRPVLEFLTAPVPVVSDIAGTKIQVVDLIEKFGGAKAKGLRSVIDVIKGVDNLVARIASLEDGANVQLPLGRIWFPKVLGDDQSYEYGSFRYDNVAIGYGIDSSNPDAAAALDALTELRDQNPDSPKMAGIQQSIKDSVKKGGIRIPILDNPLTAFQMMMGEAVPLFTYTLPSVSLKIDARIPLAQIICFELGVGLSFELDAKLMFGFDTYGFKLYETSGDILDVTQGFYVSDRANADGTGADTAEFRAVAGLALYGGINTGFAKAGVEGGVRVVAELDLNDPNNDGKLRLTEALGLFEDTGNPLDLFDARLKGEAYAAYYYDVLGIISGRKDFARIELFNLEYFGSDGTPLQGSVINYEDKDTGTNYPGTLLLHVGENAPKRVSNQDPLGAKDGDERYKIWNVGSTVYVDYRNYSEKVGSPKVRSYDNVKRVVFDGGSGADVLDATGLSGIPLEFRGGDGNDEVTLGTGHATDVTTLDGGAGNDRITVTGGGLVTILGGLGNDRIIGGTGVVVIDAGGGDDLISTRDGSTSTIVFGSQYGSDGLNLAEQALQNLLDATGVPSAVEFALTGSSGSVKAGEGNVASFNLPGVTEIRGSTDSDTFRLVDPRTRNANGGKGLLLRGGLGDDIYDFTINDAGGIAGNGILVDDVRPVTAATAGAVELCSKCKSIEKIAVASGGSGYTVAPEVRILDDTGYGAKATATIDETGRVVSIQVIEEGRNYTKPTVVLVAPGSFNDRLVFSSVRPAAALTRSGDGAATYTLGIDGKTVRFVGVGPSGMYSRQPDTSEIDSVTVNLPEGVFTLDSVVTLFDTFTVNASRMVQNARIVADTVGITTAHGFQIRHPIDTTFSGDIRIRVTGDGSATGIGDINAPANLARAVANVSGGSVTSLSLVDATGMPVSSSGGYYFFDPSFTVGASNPSAGTGARFAATRTGDSLTGFERLSGGSGYFTSPAPIVVIPPPASIQLDATVTTSSRIDNVGRGDGRGRVILYADTGMVATSGEVFFPTDTTPGAPSGSRVVEWIDGDFRYRARTTLDDIVSSTTYPGVSVGTGAQFEAVLDKDGRIESFKRIAGGTGYSEALPPLVEVEGLATATPVVNRDGSIDSLVVTYPGDGYGQPPKVTIRPNGFGRIVASPTGATLTAAGDQLLNRVHVRSMGGTLVAVGGAGVGDPLKPIKSDVETFVAQVTGADRGVHVLEKDGLRIGLNSGINGIRTLGGDVTVTTFGAGLELGQPRQLVDANGSPLWQDLAKTIPIYDRDPVTGKIIYEGGQIAVGAGDVKLTADDIEVNVELNESGGGGSIVLQPVKVAAEIGLSGTRARVGVTVADGKLTGFDPTKFWGGRGYEEGRPPLVIVDPAGQRAFGSAVVQDGRVTAVDVIYGGTNYDPAKPPVVSLSGGGASTQATVEAIVSPDGVIAGFKVITGGGGYQSAPNVSIESPGQALIEAVLDTVKDPVTGRYAVKEFRITNAGRNYKAPPSIEVAAPYDFTLDADEIAQFDTAFEQVVIGRIEGQHVFHSPEAALGSGVVLRAPRAGGTLDVAKLSATGPIAIVGSGSTFHFDAAGPTISGASISIDDNVIVHKGVAAVATAADGSITIFGSGKGMIDGAPGGDEDGDDEDLLLAAHTTVTVTGAIGSRWKLDDLTITSATGGAISLDQSVGLTGNLRITGSNADEDSDEDDAVGAVTIGGIVTVGGDLIIDASSMVTFSADVSVGGNLRITGASGVSFLGGLTVGGTIELVDVAGTVRFGGLVTVVTADKDLVVTAASKIEFLGGLAAEGDVTLMSDAIDLKGGVATVVGSGDSTLVLRPKTANRPIRVGTPQGLPNDTLDISDADLAAIDDGWKRVVIGDEAVGTGAVTIGSIGSQQGGRNSSLASTTTIVGGSVTVTQKVDVAATAAYLQLVARTGDVTVNAAINETASERNAWLRLEAVQGDVTIKAPIRSTQTVSLISGKTTSQTSTASIITSGLRVSSGGAVTLESQGNAFDALAVVTTDDAISIRENSGYTIGTVDGVSGVTVGTATATLRSTGPVGQSAAGVVSAAELSLQGVGGTWTLTQGNAIGTLSANTGSLSVADVAELTVGSITASKASGTAVELRAPSGIKLVSAITTAGGDVVVHDKATLEADITIDVEDGSATGEVEFRSTVDATAAGQQSLTITGKLDAQDSIGATTALESLSVSDAATLAGGKTFRTTGDQTYAGTASSTGTITVQAGSGASVNFLGNVSLGGLTTAAAKYDVELTGTSVAVTSAVTFNNTGSVTLGNDATDDLLFAGGVTSSAPSTTSLAGTLRTTNANATFGNANPARSVVLTRDATVSTGSGSATFAGTVNGARRLVVNAAGDTTFSSVVGGDTPLAHLETDAAGRTLLNGGAITTASPTSQVYNDDVVLGETTTLTANGGGAVTFAKTITGGRSLTVKTSGMTTFNGAVSILSLATDANGTTRLGANVTTSAAAGQVYDDAVILTAEAMLAAGSGAITFAKTVDGGFPLAVNTTGTSTFGGKVGDGTPLASLTTDSGITTGGTSIVTGGLIRTSGQQAWRDNVVSLATDATFRSENGAITAGAATTFSSSGKRASLSAATGIGTAANHIRLAQTEVTATITNAGDIYLVGVGDLVIASAGLLTPAGQISLGASGDIRVPSGGRITAGSVPGQGVSATKPIRWSLLNRDDAESPGSLRQVIANANTTGVAGVVVFSGSTNVFTVGSRLPDITSPLTIDGTNRGVVINANRQVDAGLILQAAATGSVVRGLTLQNFTGFGITLDGVRNTRIEQNTVTSINTVGSMGLLARGDLAGTKVLGNTFSGGLRGALLDGARNLVFGEIGNGNVLSNNRAAPSDPSFAGTGIRAQGMLTGTIVAGNTFTNNNYGFAFINALNLRLERNVFTRNSVAGIYIEGDSRGSSQTGNTFGRTQSDRNKVNLLRSQGTKFGGAEVKSVGQPQVSVKKNRK